MNIVQLNTSKATLLNGRLADIRLWSPEIGKDIADSEGLKLTDEHWLIIKLMRDYYSRFKISPVARLLKKNIKRQLGEEFANDDYLNSLFPDNVLIQGTRIAGLPAPWMLTSLQLNTSRSQRLKRIAKKSTNRKNYTSPMISLLMVIPSGSIQQAT